MKRFQVCPECGAGKTDSSELVGGSVQVTCAGCGWVGKYDDLLELRDSRTALDIAEAVSKEYLRLLGKYVARPAGLCMTQAGVVGARDEKRLARLIRAACLGAHKATLEEVEKIQKEILDG